MRKKRPADEAAAAEDWTAAAVEAAAVRLLARREHSRVELARKLRGAPSSPRHARGDGRHVGRRSVFDAQPRDEDHDGTFMTQDGASRTARDADHDSISIEEWLEREYERFVR